MNSAVQDLGFSLLTVDEYATAARAGTADFSSRYLASMTESTPRADRRVPAVGIVLAFALVWLLLGGVTAWIAAALATIAAVGWRSSPAWIRGTAMIAVALAWAPVPTAVSDGCNKHSGKAPAWSVPALKLSGPLGVDRVVGGSVTLVECFDVEVPRTLEPPVRDRSVR